MNKLELNLDQKKIITQAEKITKDLSTFVISNQAEYDRAGEYRKDIKGAYKQIEEIRFSFTRPLDDLKKKWLEFFGIPLTKLENADKILEKGRLVYYRDQERIRLEQEEKLRKAAEKKQAELDKKAAEARGKGDEAKATKYEEKSANVVAPVLAPTVEKTAGISGRKNWKFEIIDEDLIPRKYLTPDLIQIGKEVRAVGENLVIPGIRIYPDEKETVRTK